MRKRVALLALWGFGLVGCAPLGARASGRRRVPHRARGADRRTTSRAPRSLYRQILALGLDWSPVWNNLAVIAVHRHEYSAARKLLAHAVAANERDVVALTNYGVMSYHLSDYAEARNTLEEARRLRIQLIDCDPVEAGARRGKRNSTRGRRRRSTRRRRRYLARIDSATISDAPLPAADLMADLHVVDTLPPRARFWERAHRKIKRSKFRTEK